MEACLVVIGVDLRTASAEARERFSLSKSQRESAARQIAHMTGIEEVVVFAGRTRTEFIVWSRHFSTAADSVLTFLMRHYGLRLSEWQHFYRLMCDDAVRHVFRLASGLTDMVAGDAQTAAELNEAWDQAKRLHRAGTMLEQIFRKAFQVAERIRDEIAFPKTHGHDDASSAISKAEALVALELRNFTRQSRAPDGVLTPAN